MRTFDFSRFKCDKRYVIAYIIVCVSAIICGIVLCITVQINPYMQNYASEYVYFVFTSAMRRCLCQGFFTSLCICMLFFLLRTARGCAYCACLFCF